MQFSLRALNSLWYAVLIFGVLAGCSGDASKPEAESTHPTDAVPIPQKYDSLKNITSFSGETEAPYEVSFTKEVVFDSNEEVFFDGYISHLEVDEKNRVYLAVQIPGAIAIHVFQPDGIFLTTIGRHGRGPGEFEKITSIDIWKNRLYVFDSIQQRISVFLLDDFSLVDDFLIKRNSLEKGEIPPFVNPRNIHVRDDSTYLIEFVGAGFSNEFRKHIYYKLSKQGEISSGRILELERYTNYRDEIVRLENITLLPFVMSFTRHSLITISNKGDFYTAWTEDFLIKRYSHTGGYEEGFYHLIKKSELDLSIFNINTERKKDIHKAEVPDYWPALHTMTMDDENRLWIATITDSDSTFDWKVTDEEGKLVGSFTFPGKKKYRSVVVEPLYKIKNGYFYELERDIQSGIDRIVKHKVEFVER